MTEEKEILKRLAKGDHDAFDILFRQYYRYLVSVSCAYTNDLSLSRDLAQEVFLDIWKRRKDLKINTSFRAFIRKAVINQSMNAKSKSAKISNLEMLPKANEIAGDVSKELAYDELSNKIREIISNLPERCRLIFGLSRFENKSHKEIAAQLSISTKTIENQMTKALKQIRSGLKEADYISGIGIFLSFLNTYLP